MRQSDHEYEEWSFGDIQRAIDFENSINDLEAQLYYRRLSPKEVAQQVLRATCQFYDADWCGLIQVDLDLSLWTPFWWFNTGATDKTTLLTEEYESAEFLDRWVQAVRKGIPMVVLDAEVTKEAYPAEYNLYQRLGIRSVIAVSLEPRPVALLAVRNPKRYIQQTSMLRILAYVQCQSGLQITICLAERTAVVGNLVINSLMKVKLMYSKRLLIQNITHMILKLEARQEKSMVGKIKLLLDI